MGSLEKTPGAVPKKLVRSFTTPKWHFWVPCWGGQEMRTLWMYLVLAGALPQRPKQWPTTCRLPRTRQFYVILKSTDLFYAFNVYWVVATWSQSNQRQRLPLSQLEAFNWATIWHLESDNGPLKSVRIVRKDIASKPCCHYRWWRCYSDVSVLIMPDLGWSPVCGGCNIAL